MGAQSGDPLGRTTERDFTRSRAMNDQLLAVIPGGAHTYAKALDQYPEGMAPVIARGQGAHVWDVDGNRYVEYGSGLRAVVLGHAHPTVNARVIDALPMGANFVRPAAIELEAAQALLSVLPKAEMVKFAKNGSDATTGAVKLARAATKRDLVGICREHPFFSVDDWFIGSTPMSAGIPQAVRDLTVTFAYGDLDSARAMFEAHPEQIACIILEAATLTPPPAGYFDGLRALCDQHGTLLVLDEMITGFRLALGGAQDLYGIDPDLSTFGKAMGNGFAVSALAGKARYMRLGGFEHDEERVFLLSTTHGAETHALAAHLAVLDVHREEKVVDRLEHLGGRLRERVEAATAAASVSDHVQVLGLPANMVYTTLDADGERSQPYRTLFLTELLNRGVLAPSLVISAALTDEDIELTANAVYEAGLVYRKALDDGIDAHLRSRPVKPAIRQFA